ncbi:MAG TPA: DUF1571 domain-containing protein, partial [Bacteroidia bacterium]|nr:DUF1571 domain-containing protein [Bacteroidia bacterium]
MKEKTKISLRILFVAATISILFAAKPAPDKSAIIDAHSIINDLFKAIDNAKTLTYTMVHSERLDGSTISTDSSQVKSQKSPHKIFMKMSDGAEVLWQDGVNNGNAWVHPNSFPFVTLELDPDGMIMRKNQHHGVEYAGYDYFKDVLKQA